MQQLADTALMQMHTKHPGDFSAQIAATPAHHAVRLTVRARANPVGEFTLLRRRQFARRATAMRAVEQPHNTLGVVAVNPVPQRLAFHARLTRRQLSAAALQQKRYRQHAPYHSGILRACRPTSHIRRRQLQS